MTETNTYYVNENTGNPIQKKDMRYVTDRILLITEDDANLLHGLEASVKRVLRRTGTEDLVSLCSTSSVSQASKHLGQYRIHSPNAEIYASLDLNMGLNTNPGERRPTEALFYNGDFKHLATNGGVIVLYTGFPEQVLQSEVILAAQRDYNCLALFVATKSDPRIRQDDVFKLLLGAAKNPQNRDKLRTFAQSCRYNLGTALNRAATQRRKRRR